MWHVGGIFRINKRSRLLIYDLHRTQTAKRVKEALEDVDITISMVAPGTTSKSSVRRRTQQGIQSCHRPAVY